MEGRDYFLLTENPLLTGEAIGRWSNAAMGVTSRWCTGVWNTFRRFGMVALAGE